MAEVAQRPSSRSARLGIRATPEQEAILKRAAGVPSPKAHDL